MATLKNRLIVLDAHAIIHRAYHALPSFSNSEGLPTGALYGLFTMVTKIIGDLKPTYIVAAYDLPKKTFRHEAYKEYKGTRQKTDEELIMQIKGSRALFEAMAIPIYECEGFEADDVIGTIVELTKKEKLEVIIASGDMDTLQLVEKNRVKVFTLKKGINDTTFLGFEDVITRFGFKPIFIPDYKGLRGDPSDNIIGIKGIGDKTASQLIIDFGSLEDVFKFIKKNPDGFLEKGYTKRIRDLLLSNEEEAFFSKILATIRRDVPIDFKLEDGWLEKIDQKKVEEFCFKYEFKKPLAQFKSIFLNNKWIKNDSFEEKKEEEIADPELDRKLKIMTWILNSENSNPEMEQIFSITKTRDKKQAELFLLKELKNTGQINIFKEIEEPIIDVVADMSKNGALIDVDYLKKLSTEYTEMLSGYEKQIFSLAGESFNIKSPKQISEILFNKLSLPTKGIKKNPSGGYSTNEDNLEKLLGQHSIIPLILSYREIQKLLSTYIDTLPSFIDSENRIHAEFIQDGTSTGRFSSQNPNLQNIPIKTSWGSKIRKAFICPPSFILASFDYSQIELRVLAILSGDPYLEDAFVSKKDIHTAIAEKIFNVESSQVTKEMRSKAKTINFGILYGMGVSALQKSLETNRLEAQSFYNSYFEKFSNIKEYFEELKSDATKNGYSQTLFGRRRYLPGLRSRIPFIKSMAERLAVNAPIQGTATADIIKLAIRYVDEFIKKESLEKDIKMILQIHDELVFEIKEDIAEDVCPKIQEIMQRVLSLSWLGLKTKVPLVVNFSIGKDWASGK